ncbi:tetratricopeptide repeat protein [Flavobacterium sp. ACAM 123]|jgi:tetratricopeptide (TPR) repeat protein|uniref:tetratricopeptide repeat protein n=1 Tax=Flavobacterium sp. ACAM 123 TaxID=1189620 RepID=UPI00031D1E7A|nr:tetratricopeptide repeat protein [Flavobacterium sp. ACAM 123]
MNVTAYTTLINKPNTVSGTQTLALEKVLDEFPFFQSAQALRLKGLYNENSFKYNFALKVTAAHTTDRAVLFDFITSEGFIAIQKDLYDQKALELLDIDIIGGELISPPTKLEAKKNKLEQSIQTSIKEASPIDLNENLIVVEEKLAIGAPLDFSTNEKHSFQEWLQLSRTQPIDRANEKNNIQKPTPKNEGKKKKAALIDKFIESSPKISPVKHGVASTVRIDINKDDHSSLMTETLARVYLEQKKYQKAIQAYEILILKYPEKSSFFADRIMDIKILQQNNN